MRRYGPSLALVAVGTLIGAGFASGREIFFFFVTHGTSGLLGAVVSAVLLALATWSILEVAARQRATSYRDLCRAFPPPLSRLAQAVVSVGLGSGLVVMVAGGAELFHQLTGGPRLAGAATTAGLGVALAVRGPLAVIWFNRILVPVLILSVMGLSLATLAAVVPFGTRLPGAASLWPRGPGWFSAVLAYAFSNSVGLLGVLGSFGHLRTSSLGRLGGGLLTGALVGLPLVVATAAQLVVRPGLTDAPLPFYLLSIQLGSPWPTIYAISLGMALLTTAVGQIYALGCLLSRLASVPPHLASLLSGVLAVPLALIGFAALVEHLYPLLGLGGLLIAYSLCLYLLQSDDGT